MAAVKFLNKRTCPNARMLKVSLAGVQYSKLCDVTPTMLRFSLVQSSFYQNQHQNLNTLL